MAVESTNQRKVAATVCAGLLLIYALVAWISVSTKSPTYDEPYHAVSAWTQLRLHDYRLDNEDPPLWQYWAALPNGASALHPNLKGFDWTSMPQGPSSQWSFVVESLYRSPGTDAAKFVTRSRGMMLVWAVVLGVAIAAWAGKLGGPVAAVVACFAFCFDPNFLAHGPLVKNDVTMSLALLGVAWATWHVGRKVTWPRVVALGFLCGVALTVKFSGFIAVAVVPLMLLWRAMSTDPWPVLKRGVTGRPGRLAVAAGLVLFTAGVSVFSIWAVYGFRFRPTCDAETRLNLDELERRAAQNETIAAYGGNPPAAAMESPTPGLVPRGVAWADGRRLLPEAYLAGFLFTYEESLVRDAYLLGQSSRVGWWYYFPVAMLVKTPTATLIVVAMAGGLLVSRVGRAGLGRPGRSWALACLAGPAAVFMLSAMRSNLNIGLRHVLPVYPLLFVGVGWAAAAAWNRWRRPVRTIVWSAGVILAAESLTAIPDFIPFFNVPSHVVGEPIELLSDSNLDWGQDLPALLDWQVKHPDKTLVLAYFGLADPRYFGLRYQSMPGGYRFDSEMSAREVMKPSPAPGLTIAISASDLQGVGLSGQPPAVMAIYKGWMTRRPTAVLGGSIYLFELTPEEIARGAY